MTNDEKYLVTQLRLELLHSGYPQIYAVDNATLCAVEKAIEENLIELGLPPIITVGKYGPYFKNVQLVLRVDNDKSKT